MQKIYHYEGYYHFFLREEEIPERPDGVGLPAFSTDIPPPLDKCTENQIPVFKNDHWVVVENDFWRPKSIELNYDAGRLQNTYKREDMSFITSSFPNYPSMPMLCNAELIVRAICERNNFIHDKFELIISLHQKVAYGSTVSDLYKYKLEIESMVFMIRKILDSLVQLTYLLTSFDEFLDTKILKYNEIGKFTNLKFPEDDAQKIIIGFGNHYSSDDTGFLYAINGLFNSYKHSLMHDETYSLLCTEVPTFVSYQAKYNNHNSDIIYHNYNAYHIMMGYQDTVKRLLDNKNKYYKKHLNIVNKSGVS